MKICSLLLLITFLLASCSSPTQKCINKIDKLKTENSNLRTEIERLENESEERKKYVKIVSEIVDEVYRELWAIDLGSITLYSGDLPKKRETIWKRRRNEMLNKIDQVKELIDKNQELVMALKLTHDEKEKFKRLAEDLQDKLDAKRNEINRLICDNFKLQKENLNLHEKILVSKEEILEYKVKISTLERETKTLKGKYENEVEKSNKKYLVILTGPKLKKLKLKKCDECVKSRSLIKIKGQEAKILSDHQYDVKTYELKKRDKELHTLNIYDWNNFWKNSRILVVFCK